MDLFGNQPYPSGGPAAQSAAAMPFAMATDSSPTSRGALRKPKKPKNGCSARTMSCAAVPGCRDICTKEWILRLTTAQGRLLHLEGSAEAPLYGYCERLVNTPQH